METPDFLNNKEYKSHLAHADDSFYAKYVNDARRLLMPRGRFLDVGCGTGNVLRILARSVGVDQLFGIEVSEFFVEEIKDTLQIQVFGGETIPYEDESFEVVGSFTVLEHVRRPKPFLDEQIRVLKKGGFLIVACPNFLSFFNHVRGYSTPKKFLKQTKLLITKEFEPNEPIVRETFESDDDAIVVTNLVPLIAHLRRSRLELVEIEGTMGVDKNRLIKFLTSKPGVRLFLPSCYVIARKPTGSRC